MPYIKNDIRDYIWQNGDYDVQRCHNPGDLNFLLTKIVVTNKDLKTLETTLFKVVMEYHTKNSLCYQVCNDVVGAIIGCSLELKRRKRLSDDEKDVLVHVCSKYYDETVGPNEDLKISENGDV